MGCGPTGKNAALICQATQTIGIEKSRQVILVITVAPWRMKNSDADFVVRVRLPHGVNIPAGVQIKIDDAPSRSLVIQTSTKEGLFARTGLSEGLLSSMKRGAVMHVSFQSLAGKKLQIPTTLKGFSAVFSKLK